MDYSLSMMRLTPGRRAKYTAGLARRGFDVVEKDTRLRPATKPNLANNTSEEVRE